MSTAPELMGKVCLVTGGAQGIGLATTKALARRGARVHAAEISPGHLKTGAEQVQAAGLGDHVVFHRVDVTDRNAYEQCITDVHAAEGRLDVLVNNAAFTQWRDVADMSVEDAQRTMRTGYDAMVYSVKAALPLMQAAGGGTIVNMGSAAGVVLPKGPSAAYAAAKAAINAYTQVLAAELATSPVHVMLVRPGTVAGTEFFGRHVPSQRMPRITDFLPVSSPEQIADAIVHGIIKRRDIVDTPGYLPAMYRAYAMAPTAFRSLAALGGNARRNYATPVGRGKAQVSRRPAAARLPARGLGFRLMNKIAPTPWAGAVMRTAMVPLDTLLQDRTRGRFSVGRTLGVPSLLLTTTGARTGRPRPTPLFHVEHDGGYAVVGSNFGLQHHPAWTNNLLKTPAATVSIAGRQIPVTGRLLDGPEGEQVWHKILTTLSTGYQTYSDRSGRNLRIFHLQPAGPAR
ncbi:SDR family NAD(P)-dependent oxidoreductase [Streptomyces sp. YS415]|uniref:SDR family NAD(P)-dependent oxidoreductase n=1 Tax=Streptomyces sp. YS415 TaxID=2944806 RepID=UPI0020219896|nr:SDR family NAD(P)-dependent oxidoreductase [Streptomyces sp. YS415]MCL7430397.1 SDR family NAD(P)-dependent oxidoreductase [Streptomyces sp. YS415]